MEVKKSYDLLLEAGNPRNSMVLFKEGPLYKSQSEVKRLISQLSS